MCVAELFGALWQLTPIGDGFVAKASRPRVHQGCGRLSVMQKIRMETDMGKSHGHWHRQAKQGEYTY